MIGKLHILRILWLTGILWFLGIISSFAQEIEPFESQREMMVLQQIKTRGITDKTILDAFGKVPRHEFVLPEYLRYAYADSPLPIAEGQTISQPYIVAFKTDALKLKSTDKVLEIGTGSGYQSAILGEICDSVFTIEIYESLSKNAERLLSKLAYKNILTKIGDGYRGWPEHAPFDAIIVTCSPTHVPQALKNQLAEGGRMIIPVGEGRVQHLILLEKKRGNLKEKNVLPVRFVPMIDQEKRKY